MLDLVAHYATSAPGNLLEPYLPALQAVNGSASHAGLDPTFVSQWKTAAKTTMFQKALEDERGRVYFDPAVDRATADGLGALGQLIDDDAMVFLGPGNGSESQGGVRLAALAHAALPRREETRRPI